jgi:branched-chain amino acid transport system substrate-binding protein
VAAIADWSLVDEPWASAVQAAKIPVVGGNLSEATFYTNPDFYPEGQTNDSITESAVITAKTAGATSLGIFYCVEAPTCLQGASQAKGDGQKLGLPATFNASIAGTAPNYTAQCVAAQQARISTVLILDSVPAIVKVGTSCSQQGYNPTYIEEGEGFGMQVAAAPGVMRDLWGEYNNIPFFASTPAVQTMNAAVDKYYPGLRSNATYWTELDVGGWASGLLLEDAVKAGGVTASDTPSAAEIVSGLDSLKGDTLEGMSPSLTFAAGQMHTIDCWFTARVQNGVPSVVNGGKLTCEPTSSS